MSAAYCIGCGGGMDWRGKGQHTCPPRRTSGRTTGEIVAAVEERLRAVLIVPGVTHEPSCRCVECFNAQLDLMIAGKPITWKGENHEPVRDHAEN